VNKIDKDVSANAEKFATVKSARNEWKKKLRSKPNQVQGSPVSAENASAPTVAVKTTLLAVEAAASLATGSALPIAASATRKPVVSDEPSATARAANAVGQRQSFKLNEFVVYPAHGVGQIVAVEEQEVAGFKLELFVINFSKDKLTLRVPTSKVADVGMRRISDPDAAKRSLEILTGRARVKRTMWSRRAQEYEAKINSGDIRAIAEVVRDLYRSDQQPGQSYSERQLYEAALDQIVREIATVHKSNETDALKVVEAQLQKGRASKAVGAPGIGNDIEEAA
jgi:CarD family transcriptional regulator, regulator of rRNA transcription